MEQIIYGDVLFIVNFSMDFLSLYITSKLLHKSAGVFALVFSACIGALYGVISIFQSGNVILNALINLAVAMLMCYILFGFGSILSHIRNTIVFYSVSFLLGGAMTALYTLINNGLAGRNIVINGNNHTLYADIPISAFAVIAVISVIFSYICGFILKRKASQKNAKIKITYKNKTIELEGLCDTGNLLCEPAGGLSVAVCAYDKLEPILPIGVRPLFREAKIGLLEFADQEFAKRVRIIPVSHVGGKGILIGLIPDRVEINGEDKKLCIACTNDTKSFGEKECIIPASVL